MGRKERKAATPKQVTWVLKDTPGETNLYSVKMCPHSLLGVRFRGCCYLRSLESCESWTCRPQASVEKLPWARPLNNNKKDLPAEPACSFQPTAMFTFLSTWHFMHFGRNNISYWVWALRAFHHQSLRTAFASLFYVHEWDKVTGKMFPSFETLDSFALEWVFSVCLELSSLLRRNNYGLLLARDYLNTHTLPCCLWGSSSREKCIHCWE